MLLHSASNGCAEPANHWCWPRPRHTGRMADRCRRRADCPFPTAEERRGEDRRGEIKASLAESMRVWSVRQGALHPTSSAARTPVRLPSLKAASSTAVVRTLRETVGCFGQCCQVLCQVLCQILLADASTIPDSPPRLAQWRRHASLCISPSLRARQAHRLPVPRVHLTLTIGRREGAGAGHAHAIIHPCCWAALAPNSACL